ncbi:MAG: hypothetical protein H6608_00465 [Flavobacteriales bacterium]|nr:hypothetical protein [Bacteroidota bacterium]MCB9239578.1 hypothetical protein [Flavobacteriales bacterium]
MRSLLAWLLLIQYLTIFGGDLVHHVTAHETDHCSAENQHICDSEFEFHPCLLCLVNHSAATPAVETSLNQPVDVVAIVFQDEHSNPIAQINETRSIRGPPFG